MFDKLRKILEKVDAEFAEIRHEAIRQTLFLFEGKGLSQLSSNSTDGFTLRLLKNGGLSFVSFIKESNAEKAIKRAMENALLLSQHVEQPIKLADVEVTKDSFIPQLDEDPRNISIDEKVALIRKYHSIPLKQEIIATATLKYEDVSREKYYVNTEGTEIREDLITTRLNGCIIGRDGNLVQDVRLWLGGGNGFSAIRNQENYISERTALACDLLKAKPVPGGVYNVVLNQFLTGAFAHESFGHYSEADVVKRSPGILKKMRIGTKIGNDVLCIKDDPTLKGRLGFYAYDDEGVRARPVQLMKNGVLTGRLHSRITAEQFGEPVTGHCIATSFRKAAQTRMGTIFIEPSENSFEELLSMLGDGLYLYDTKGGQTSGESFTFGIHHGYEVRNGKIGKLIPNTNISGNIFETLRNVAAIGNDLDFNKVGGCADNIRSCLGGPHILIKNLVIGGK